LTIFIEQRNYCKNVVISYMLFQQVIVEDVEAK